MNKTRSTTAVVVAIVCLASTLTVACGSAIRENIDDATITARVKTMLLNAPDVNATHIDVQTAQGVVTLTGTVTSADEEQRAVAVARKGNGVRDVRSQLKIQPQQR